MGMFVFVRLKPKRRVHDANEPNEHEQVLVRVRLLINICVHELFMNTYRPRFYVRVCLLRK
ncbi:hypothetical protein HanRHA438_Chr09g0427431 [Helianthus annuus]|nr:hypothetical protein HanRHA438_Chr09g0427431 [Helianthus annuus]